MKYKYYECPFNSQFYMEAEFDLLSGAWFAVTALEDSLQHEFYQQLKCYLLRKQEQELVNG